MSKWLSWSSIAAFALAGAACNGAIVPVGQDTGEDAGGSHNTTGCTGPSPTCPAYCDGKFPAGPGECLNGIWTCVESSCPAEPDSGTNSSPDASSGCSEPPPVCGPCPAGYPPPAPACIQGQWDCGDICGGTTDGGTDDGPTGFDDGGFDDGSFDDGPYFPDDAGLACAGNTPTCPAECDGIVPPGPATCFQGNPPSGPWVWTCLGASCPALEDAAATCNGNAPTCAPGCEGTIYFPSCVNGQWTCIAPTC